MRVYRADSMEIMTTTIINSDFIAHHFVLSNVKVFLTGVVFFHIAYFN